MITKERNVPMGGGFSKGSSEADKEVSTNKAMDKISELPEVLIHHIQSFLETKEAAQTSVLSKYWHRAWSTSPFLDFDQTNFGLIRHQKNYDDAHVEDTLLKLVNDTLESYKQREIPIQKLRLHIDTITPSKFVPLMKKWLRRVLQNGVVELDFNVRWEESVLPSEIFGAKALQVLKVTSKIYGYKLVLGARDIIKCRNLKKLELDGVAIDGATFRNLTCYCPLIEELHLKDCGWSQIHVANLPNLKVLSLECLGVESVNIDAPRLQSLTCRSTGMLNIGVSGNLKRLSLSDSPITDEQMQNILSTNPHLEDLCLVSCNMLERINFSSLFLKYLHLDRCRKMVEVIINAPNLALLEYHYMSRAPLPITTPTANGEANISIYCGGEICKSWFYEFREFLTKFRKSNVEITSYRDIEFDLEGFRGIPLPRGHEVETLALYYERSTNMAHLDGLLCVCHPKTCVIMYEDKTTNNALVKNFCKELKNRKNPKCSNMDTIKSWLHIIKDAKFNIRGVDEQKRLGLIQKMSVSFALEWD